MYVTLVPTRCCLLIDILSKLIKHKIGFYRFGLQRRLRRDCAFAPDPSQLEYTNYGIRYKIKPSTRQLAPFRRCTCTFIVISGSCKFSRRRSKFDNDFLIFFVLLIDEGIWEPNTTINGPSSARQRNSI